MKKIGNKVIKCPVCDTSDFKAEKGNLVCQICGHQIPVENIIESTEQKEKATVVDKGTDKIVKLIAFGFLAFLSLINVIDYLQYIEYMMFEAILSILSLASMIYFIIVTIRQMYGHSDVGKSYKILMFGAYAAGRLVPFVMNLAYGNGLYIVGLLFAIIYIAVAWMATFKFEKWLKK